ncbi:MAG TPA: lytic transglycosylase domain-containing protein [Vicinamibacterales bacterium]
MPHLTLLPGIAVDGGVGLRGRSDRRGRDRRQRLRAAANRRRRNRRVAAAALLGATFAPLMYLIARPEPSAAVTIAYIEAIPPERAYEHLIQEAARTYDLDAALIRAVMQVESSFNPLVVSPAGASGLMQLMPSVSRQMGVRDPFNPRENVMAGARYLRDLLDRHNGSIELTLASYNAGPAAVARHRNTIPPFKETRTYVRRITQLMAGDPGRTSTDD